MNRDEIRLRDITMLLSAYYHELDKADSISDCINIKEKIDELELEQKEILKNCKVEV